MQTEVGLPLPASVGGAASSSQPCYANLPATSASAAAAVAVPKKKKPAASPPSSGAVQRDYENFR